jgi:hypothetical protein
VDLIVELIEISQPGFLAACARVAAKPLLVCGRCENIEEIVGQFSPFPHSTHPGLCAACVRGMCLAGSAPFDPRRVNAGA